MHACNQGYKPMLLQNRGGRALGIAVACALFLTACSSDDMADLKSYVATVKARPAGRIPPLPAFETYVTVPYTAAHLRDPFMPFMDIAESGPAPSQKPSTTKPPQTHKPEALEKFPLDGLKFVGILERGSERWGIIIAPDNLVHHVKIGDYLGENNGKITSISETKIELVETVSDGAGGWTDRPAAISVVE